jgi:hypothetical protein
MIITGDNVQVLFTNSTLNQVYTVPYNEGTFTETPIYKEKKVWKQNSINKYIRSDIKLDLNSVELSDDVLTWFRNNNTIVVQVIFDPEGEQITKTIINCKFDCSIDWKDEDLVRYKLSISGILST